MNTESRQRVPGSNPLLRVPHPSSGPAPTSPMHSFIKRASTHATVAPPPISDHPLAFCNSLTASPWYSVERVAKI